VLTHFTGARPELREAAGKVKERGERRERGGAEATQRPWGWSVNETTTRPDGK